MSITNDVDIPNEVFEAGERQKLVFFVGAGLSMQAPSNLPNFWGLTQDLANMAYVDPPNEKTPLDVFLGRFPENFAIQKQTRDYFRRKKTKANKGHEALAKICTAYGVTRVITTNYDSLLEESYKKAKGQDSIPVLHYPMGSLLKASSIYMELSRMKTRISS